MGKSVRFSDKVDVRYMGMSLEEHSREVKTPSDIIVNKRPQIKSTSNVKPVKSTSLNPSFIWWGIAGILVSIFICYVIWKLFFSKNNRENVELEKKDINKK